MQVEILNTILVVVSDRNGVISYGLITVSECTFHGFPRFFRALCVYSCFHQRCMEFYGAMVVSRSLVGVYLSAYKCDHCCCRHRMQGFRLFCAV